MTLFQIILLILVTGILILYLRFSRNQVINRLGFFLFFGAGIIFIVNPDLSSRVANAMGIGRGADLIFYFNTVVLYLAILILYRKNRKLQQDLTKIVRENSINNARQPVE